jgi:DnaJ-domain-containing protein 1
MLGPRGKMQGERRHGMQHSGPGRSDEDPYQVLGVNVGASREDIVRAYRRAVYHAHPDTHRAVPGSDRRLRPAE